MFHLAKGSEAALRAHNRDMDNEQYKQDTEPAVNSHEKYTLPMKHLGKFHV